MFFILSLPWNVSVPYLPNSILSISSNFRYFPSVASLISAPLMVDSCSPQCVLHLNYASMKPESEFLIWRAIIFRISDNRDRDFVFRLCRRILTEELQRVMVIIWVRRRFLARLLLSCWQSRIECFTSLLLFPWSSTLSFSLSSIPLGSFLYNWYSIFFQISLGSFQLNSYCLFISRVFFFYLNVSIKFLLIVYAFFLSPNSEVNFLMSRIFW